MVVYQSELSLECDAEVAFEFLRRPINLMQISPPEMNLQFLEAPEVLDEGDRFTFQVSAHGQKQRFEHEITSLTKPLHFIEQQVTGIMKHWVHKHGVEQTGDCTITLTDHIEFTPPSGLVGFLLNEQRIRSSLETGFAYRHQQLKNLLCASSA